MRTQPFKQILTAELAFDKPPTFDKLAPGQPSREEIVQWGLSEGREGHVKLPSNSRHVTNHRGRMLGFLVKKLPRLDPASFTGHKCILDPLVISSLQSTAVSSV
jgi:hypothetical protein